MILDVGDHPACRRDQISLILAHNHPSGDPTPSSADLDLARALMQSGRLLGISLDDHLIIGRNSYISLHQKGYLLERTKY